MIDVVFLLLTFLLFSLALSARYRVTSVALPPTSIGAEASPRPSSLVEIDADGGVRLDGRGVAPDDLSRVLADARAAEADLIIFVAVDERAPAGRLLPLMDKLREAGFAELRFLRQPDDAGGP